MKTFDNIQKPSVVAAQAAAKTKEQAANAFVNEVEEQNKRLTIDLPESLHTAVKIGCARRKLKIAEIVRAFLEHEFADEVAAIKGS